MNKHHNSILLEEECRIYETFDQDFCRLAKERFNAVSIKVPSTIDSGTIHKMGYLQSFNEHITKATPPNKKQDEDFYLIPAACVPLYAHLAPKEMHDNKCYTFNVPVYRWENGRRDKYRYWEFSVREIVFVGSEDYVKECLDAMTNKIVDYAAEKEIKVIVEHASDYFTGKEEEIQTLKRLQKVAKLKREILWKSDQNETVALASVNNHLTHFSRMYGWDEGGSIISGCTGFGLERWVQMRKDLLDRGTNNKTSA